MCLSTSSPPLCSSDTSFLCSLAADVFHGFVFSLFVVDWLKTDGSRTVFITLGGIHIALLLFSIPMYIYGKRARMWTVRKHLMEKY